MCVFKKISRVFFVRKKKNLIYLSHARLQSFASNTRTKNLNLIYFVIILYLNVNFIYCFFFFFIHFYLFYFCVNESHSVFDECVFILQTHHGKSFYILYFAEDVIISFSIFMFFNN